MTRLTPNRRFLRAGGNAWKEVSVVRQLAVAQRMNIFAAGNRVARRRSVRYSARMSADHPR